MAALRNLATNADNKVTTAAAGGVAAILGAMRRHASVEAVQAKACGVLQNLAIDADNKVATAVAGGVAAILGAMRRHAGSHHNSHSWRANWRAI